MATKRQPTMPKQLYVWKETDKDGESYYLVSETIDDIGGEDAVLVGKYALQSTGKLVRSVAILFGNALFGDKK